MYLSRLQLNETARKTMIALSDPRLFHSAVQNAFWGERRHLLWRVDTLRGRKYLLLLSDEIPDLQKAYKEFGGYDIPQIKEYDALLDSVKEGEKWTFRLCANPTYSIITPQNKRGRVCAHSTAENQKNWLEKQSGKNGFCLSNGSFDTVHTKWYQFKKASGDRVSLLAVTYEGWLEVTDANKFRNALINGIGRGKAYGMGLLTIMRPKVV